MYPPPWYRADIRDQALDLAPLSLVHALQEVNRSCASRRKGQTCLALGARAVVVSSVHITCTITDFFKLKKQ